MGREKRREAVRVVVCGPPGSGKTCFVTAAATESFPEHVPPQLPPTLLGGAGWAAPVLLVDTSSRAEERGALAQQLRQAHCVALCYAVDAPRAATLATLREEWLPELRRVGGCAPVLLLGCKLDARCEAGAGAWLAAELASELPRLEVSLECSARTLVQVHAAVHACLAAVLHPSQPLFCPERQALQPDCLAALRRVFALCDADGDSALSRAELHAFQAACYGQPLTAREAEDVLRTVAERLPCPAGVTAGGALTLAGFLYLQALFLQHGRCDAVWACLRAFGYDTQLRLAPEALPGAQVLLARPPDARAELSERALAFLDSLWARGAAMASAADCSACPALRAPQLDALFATAPGGAQRAQRLLGWTAVVDWERCVGVGGHGLSPALWSALWSLAAHSAPLETLEQLAYLCFPHEQLGAALRVGRRRGHKARAWGGLRRSHAQAAHRGHRQRITLLCALAGPPGGGGEALMEALARQGRGGATATPQQLQEGLAVRPACAWSAAPHTPQAPHTPPPAGNTQARAARGRCAVASLEPPQPQPAPEGSAAGAAAAASASPATTLILRELEGCARAAARDEAPPDLLVFAFDARSRASFAAAAQQLTELVSGARAPLGVPALLVGTQAQAGCQGEPPALHWDDGCVAAFTASLGIPQPLLLCGSAPSGVDAARLFAALAAEASSPVSAVPETRAARAQRLRVRTLRRSAGCALGGAAVLGAGLLVYRWYSKTQKD